MLKINIKNKKKEIFKTFDKNQIYKEMVKTISLHEIKIYQARVDRTNTRMQRYINSTPLRNVFARICNYAYTVKQFYTISYVTKELRSTRQAISLIVDECENEGQLNINRRVNKVEFQASEELYKSWRDSVYARTNIMTSDKLNDWISMLSLY